MKQRIRICLLAILSLALTMTASTSSAQEASPQAALAAAGTGFTYQGRLTDGGSPANGAYDFQFRLFLAVSGGGQAGGTVTQGDVTVTNGLFTVQLDFGSVFDGTALYLDIGVRPGGSSGAYTLLSPRQALTAAPYALYALNTAANDHWGETWSGPTGSSGLRLEHTATSGYVRGLTGQSASSEGVGVYGYASAASGTTYGFWGESASPAGRGVYGLASATSGFSIGVQGVTVSTEGSGVRGSATSPSGYTYGVHGQSGSTDGIGVYGWATAGSGTTYGVYGSSVSTSGSGVHGRATAANGSTYGVYGQSASNDGRGIYGTATASSGQAFGVHGVSASDNGRGVFGHATSGTGSTYGLVGQSNSPNGTGVHGTASSNTGNTLGVWGLSLSTSGTGVSGHASATTGTTFGVYGQSSSDQGYGVYGVAWANTGVTYGVYGRSLSTSGYAGYFTGQGDDVVYVVNTGGGRALQAFSPANTAIWGKTDTGIAGIDGRATGATGRGVYGWAQSTTGVNYGVYGRTSSSTGYAGYFQGNLHTTGTLSKAAGSFKIDHPLDPANQYLSHSFVESPDMKNIYDGVVALDADGGATVTLPDWFEALNQDFRYQLTPIGGWAPLYIAQEIQGNAFRIAGGEQGMKVSWMVTGIRHDAYANAHRIPVEESKPVEERGLYLHPTELGQPAELGLDYQRDADLRQPLEMAGDDPTRAGAADR